MHTIVTDTQSPMWEHTKIVQNKFVHICIHLRYHSLVSIELQLH